MTRPYPPPTAVMPRRRRAWGPEPLGGAVSFRLWAPAARSVALAAGATREIAMQAEDDGWWRLDTDAVAPGGAYAFVIDGARRVPDPASRAQVLDVHWPSLLPDPAEHEWTVAWSGRPWEEAVVYELHVGTFTPAGDLFAAAERLPHLADLGVTAVELMPLAQFGGRRGWGYDGVLLYAPHQAYGGPRALKRFVDAAHALGLMVLLDVVYNHFGPEGNYLPLYAPDFFDAGRETPWGPAIAFDRRPVRDFIVENAAWWIGEYRLDGLRLDAINQIDLPGAPPILDDVAAAARAAGRGRPIHLTTEDDRNVVRLHKRDARGRPLRYTAEWNDDFHHVAHVAATGETAGYYRDYADAHAARLARVLATGFDYQGELSAHRGRPRGEPSGGLPPTAFVDFVQNHDQIGNRAHGERLTTLAPSEAVEALTAVLLLSPHAPLLFMGEEWGETRPFLFFADFEGDLAAAVREGRRAEFAWWTDATGAAPPPDPCDPETFAASRLDWDRAATSEGAARLAFVRRLLDLRRREIAPRLAGLRDGSAEGRATEEGAVVVRWRLADGAGLRLAANLTPAPRRVPAARPGARVLFETRPGLAQALAAGPAPGWSVAWTLEDGS